MILKTKNPQICNIRETSQLYDKPVLDNFIKKNYSFVGAPSRDFPKDNIIKSTSTRNKIALKSLNNLIKERLKSPYVHNINIEILC